MALHIDKTRNMTHDDFLKLKAVILYIIDKCQTIDYFHLFKILYFADREHFAIYGRRIINDTYHALPNGPVPTILYDIIKVAKKESSSRSSDFNNIVNAIDFPDPTYNYILEAKEKPDMDELSASDIEILDKSIKENISLDFNTLSNKSHDLAWEKANKKTQKSIDEIDIARAGGANKDMIKYITDNNQTKLLLGV